MENSLFIENPITKRKIRVGGRAHNDLIKNKKIAGAPVEELYLSVPKRTTPPVNHHYYYTRPRSIYDSPNRHYYIPNRAYYSPNRYYYQLPSTRSVYRSLYGSPSSGRLYRMNSSSRSRSPTPKRKTKKSKSKTKSSKRRTRSKRD